MFLPECAGCGDVGLLALLDSASEEDHDALTVFAKVNAIAWAKIDAQFKYPASQPLGHGEIASFEPIEIHGDSRLCLIVLLFKPLFESIATGPVNVLSNLNYEHMVA